MARYPKSFNKCVPCLKPDADYKSDCSATYNGTVRTLSSDTFILAIHVRAALGVVQQNLTMRIHTLYELLKTTDPYLTCEMDKGFVLPILETATVRHNPQNRISPLSVDNLGALSTTSGYCSPLV